MKKFLVLMLLGFTVLLGATDVSGNVNGTWNLAGSPYNVMGNLLVSSGETLDINEGVVIHFRGDYTFIINGTLNAIGTAGSMIIFDTHSSIPEFGGIRFENADGGTITYATIEDGNANLGGGIYINGCSPTISYNEIFNCQATSGGGIFVHDNASPIIEWNEIHHNDASNLGGGIGFNGSGAGYLAVVQYNLIYDNVNTSTGGGGISFDDGTYADIYNNVIYNNSTASATTGGVYAHSSGNVIDLRNNIIWGNSNAGTSDPQIYDNSTNTITVTYCDVEGGFAGTGNIDSDPLFFGAATFEAAPSRMNEDFYLMSGSPCINAGDPASSIPIGGGSCVEMGVYEYIADELVWEFDVDDTFEGNELEGVAASLRAVDGTIIAWGQQYLVDPPCGGPQNVTCIGRCWILAANASGYIRLFFNAEEIEGMDSPQIYINVGGVWSQIATSDIGMEGSSLYLDSVYPISDWVNPCCAGFTICDDDPVPVTLSSFTAIFEDSSPTLHWTTQSESNNLGWNVYRSLSENLGQANQINNVLIPGYGTTSEPTDYVFTDNHEVENNTSYWYWIESTSYSGETDLFGPVTLTIQIEENPIPELPTASVLQGNYPNPFNPHTMINFSIQDGENGSLTIFNTRGQLLETHHYEAGDYQFNWNATQYGSGIYFYKLETENYINIKKMIMVK